VVRALSSGSLDTGITVGDALSRVDLSFWLIAVDFSRDSIDPSISLEAMVIGIHFRTLFPAFEKLMGGVFRGFCTKGFC